MPRLRLLTWNLWHALDPYGRPPFGHAIMLPMESPAEARERAARQLDSLRALRREPSEYCDVFCLQEINPLPARALEIGRALGWRGHSTVVNAGIKLGRFGLPPGLKEGLGIFVAQGFSSARFSEATLSGGALEIGPLMAQLGERRKALRFDGTVDGARIAVVNLHLHNGSDRDPDALELKKREVERLTQWFSASRAGKEPPELVAVCGDFNSDPESPCMEALLASGFAELSGRDPSWDPAANPLAAKSGQHASSELSREWDQGVHVFDRVYVRSSRAVTVIHREVFREPGLSDHFGSCVEIGF